MHKDPMKTSLSEVLQRLPDERLEPEASRALWQKIDQGLEVEGAPIKQVQSANNRASYWSLATAAIVVCAIGILWLGQSGGYLSSSENTINKPAIQTTNVDTANSEDLLVALQNRSKLLEIGLRQLSAPNGLSGQQAVMMDELERMIGLVDLQLSVSSANQANPGKRYSQQQFERTALWQQRVDLMQSLVTTRLDAHRGGYVDNPWQSTASPVSVPTSNYY